MAAVLLLALNLPVCIWAQSPPPDRYVIENRLKAGDLESLDAITNKAGLGALYGMLRLAQTSQFGDKSREIESEVVRRIASIDDHARILGDRIESNASKLRTQQERSIDFKLLARVGTPEATAQIGRFMDDERWPEGSVREIYESGYAGNPNYVHAASALMVALGDKSPVPHTYFFSEADARRMREWWHSPAGEEYRKLTAAAMAGESASAVKAPEAAAAVKVEPTLPASGLWVGWWVLAGVAVLGLAVWLMARARRR